MARPQLLATIICLVGTSSAASDLWKVDIDRSPAPSPEDGPPFSANATRDPKLLPYQIVGVAGSYVCTILVLGLLLMTVGRRSRKRAQALANAEKSTEMIRPLGLVFDPSPISPQSQRAWYSPRRPRDKRSAAGSVKSIGSMVSPGAESVTSFDAGVVEADRQKRAEEMERLYAAVMAQDERKSQGAEHPPTAPPEYSRRAPLRIVATPSLNHLQDETLRSPRSPVRAIYPPEPPPPLPTSPMSPVRSHELYRLGDTVDSRHRSTSFGSQSQTSVSSPNKKLRKSIRNIKISAPLMRHDDNDDGARTPLSPRVYTNPGIPPEPPTARTVDTYDSAQYEPTTPGTARSFGPDDRMYEPQDQMDEIREAPRPYPQKTITRSRTSSSINYSQPLRIDMGKSTNASAASINNPLPFRQMNRDSPSSPYQPYQEQSFLSPGPIKTTFVESRRDRLGVGTPKTGMATPYSAYMPFTPVTPVTAHISSRAERRQRERDERTMHGAITEEDRVRDDNELWDEGY